jgi:CubicO group peptidase (beta-lactamase class C family)
MAKLGYLYLNRGCWAGHQLVPEAWVKASSASQIAAGFPEFTEGYGYLWWITRYGSHGAYFAGGSGGQYIVVVPDLDLVVVTTGNTSAPPGSGIAFRQLVPRYIIPAIRGIAP